MVVALVPCHGGSGDSHRQQQQEQQHHQQHHHQQHHQQQQQHQHQQLQHQQHHQHQQHLQQQQQGEALLAAARLGDKVRCKDLLEAGANVNYIDTAGFSVLQRASCEGHTDVVKLLAKHKANVDHQDQQYGNTALHEAAWKGYSQTAELLIRAKANFYMKNKGGFVPLHLACQNGHNQTCRVLLLAGCQPDIKNNYGDTPLHTSGRYGHAGVTRILLSAHCNVGDLNRNGDTAVHIAVAMGRRKLTRILLEANADQTIKNKQNETPGDIAIRKEYVEILEILKNPPPVVTPEQRLKMEKEQKKQELLENKGKKDNIKREKKREKSTESGSSSKGSNNEVKREKKREKTNDSGTSSKDSNPQVKEKKKHKSDHNEKTKSKPIGWSPYGCQHHPSKVDIVDPKMDPVSLDPLTTGEKYFIDLTGNIKKGPAGVNNGCNCAPYFAQVETKLEKDKMALMEHIDVAHGKLGAKISSLEHQTQQTIRHLNDTVKHKINLDKEDCHLRSQNLYPIKDQPKTDELQKWVEEQLVSYQSKVMDTRPNTFAFRQRNRRRDPVTGLFPLIRSRSDETISDVGKGPRDQPYRGLRVLDHPTSMHSIPHILDKGEEAPIYESPKLLHFNPKSRRNSSVQLKRSQSTNERTYFNTRNEEKIIVNNQDDRTYFNTRHEEKISVDNQDDLAPPKNVKAKEGCINKGFRKGYRVMFDLDNISPTEEDTPKKPKHTQSSTDLNMQAFPSTTITSQSQSNILKKVPTENITNNNHMRSHTPFLSNGPDFQKNNQGIYGPFRKQNLELHPTSVLRIPTDNPINHENVVFNSNKNNEEQYYMNSYPQQFFDDNQDINDDMYLDMDRYRIQQTTRRMYDGYIADGKIETIRNKPPAESTSEKDPHNDSGYCVRAGSTSTGPSPCLPGCHNGCTVGFFPTSNQESLGSKLSFPSYQLKSSDGPIYPKGINYPALGKSNISTVGGVQSSVLNKGNLYVHQESLKLPLRNGSVPNVHPSVETNVPKNTNHHLPNISSVQSVSVSTQSSYQNSISKGLTKSSSLV